MDSIQIRPSISQTELRFHRFLHVQLDCAVVIRLASSTNIGRKEMAEGRRHKCWIMDVCLYVLGKGGLGRVSFSTAFPRSQCVNHPLYGSNSTVHWWAGPAEQTEDICWSWDMIERSMCVCVFVCYGKWQCTEVLKMAQWGQTLPLSDFTHIHRQR